MEVFLITIRDIRNSLFRIEEILNLEPSLKGDPEIKEELERVLEIALQYGDVRVQQAARRLLAKIDKFFKATLLSGSDF